jgi:hypothetical protein
MVIVSGQGITAIDRLNTFLASFTMDRTRNKPATEVTCASPLCSVQFAPSGLAMRPKRFCCDRCKVDAWHIREVSKLFKGLSDQQVLKILREGE